MISSFNVAISGLNASAKRLSVAADNIANHQSTATKVDGRIIDEPYHAKIAQSISEGLGGVSVVVKEATPPTATLFNPTAPNADANGQSRVPNVDVAEQLINQRIAGYDYKANLKSIQVQDDMLKNLLDIKS